MKERKFLFITLGLLLLIGAPAVYSVVREPVSVVPGGKNSIISKEMASSESLDRQPASISPKALKAAESSPRNAIKAKSVTVEVGCQLADQTHQTDGTLLRLKSSCWKSGGANFAVINVTNGFTASVIETQNQGFTTDYIDLQPGENRLEIKGVNQQGQVVQKTMTVNRTPASF